MNEDEKQKLKEDAVEKIQEAATSPVVSKIKIYGAIALGIIVIVAIGYLAWRVNELTTARDQQPKVIEYKNTEDADKLKDELHLSQKAAQQLAERLSAIHAGNQAPDVTYYTAAPTVEAAATKTADAISRRDTTLPAEALAKSDRTVVTANTPQQKVDVYKINLAHKHAFYGGGGYDNDNLRGAVSYQCGDSLTTVIVGHGKPAYYEQYKLIRW